MRLLHRLCLQQGFTLIECSIVCAMVAIIAAVAVPSYQGRELRAGRLDAVAALTKLQVAQEQYRSHTGLYAQDLSVLHGVPALSAQGRYRIAIASTGPEGYRAVASAEGAQRKDKDCPALALEVNTGFPHFGPSASCWNR